MRKPVFEIPRRKRAPEGFWLSPDRTSSGGGWFIPVKIHAQALMEAPEWFGLERAPHGKVEIEAAMAAVIERGWIRGRRRDGGDVVFQIHEPSAFSISAIRDFLIELPEDVKTVTLMIESPARKELDPVSFTDFVEGRTPAWWDRNPKRRR
jgi:hypothetical protein